MENKTLELIMPETPEVQPKRMDKANDRKADRESILKRPDGCDHLPVGTCFMDLPKKERKKYMWMVPDEIKNDPMYDMEPEEYKNVCKIKREEQAKQITTQEATIQLLTNSMADLIKQVNILTSKK
jgi:hypothetical protein